MTTKTTVPAPKKDNTIAFDPRKGHKRVKDFVTGRTTMYQGGRAYSEQGFPVIESAMSRSKYLCPKCDFGTGSGVTLIGHATKVHDASEKMLEVFSTYIKNIQRDLPSDEGIDWHNMSVKPTRAQMACDEMEARDGVKASGDAVDDAPIPFKCGSCPDVPPFKNQQALAAHSRRHK